MFVSLRLILGSLLRFLLCHLACLLILLPLILSAGQRLAELVLCLLLSPLSGLLSLLGLLLSLHRSLLLVLLRLILRSGQRLGKFILYLLLTSLLSLLRLPGLLCLSSLLRDLLVLLILLFAFRFGQVTAPPLLVFTPRLSSLGFAQV